MKYAVVIVGLLLASVATAQQSNLNIFKNVCYSNLHVDDDIRSITKRDVENELERLASLYRIPVAPLVDCVMTGVPTLRISVQIYMVPSGSSGPYAWSMSFEGYVPEVEDNYLGIFRFPTIYLDGVTGIAGSANDDREFWFTRIRRLFDSFVSEWNKTHP